VTLLELVLHNYKQHKDRTITFKGNIIGIVGSNGSGKSNLLGAIHFALAGEQPGFTKSELLSWGASEGYVRLTFEHGGITGTIQRALHSATASFKYGTEEVTGTKKVDERVSTILGLDKDLLKQAIFVRQAEIDDVLFTDPRIRELSFQKLCGIGDAAKIHKKLGDILSATALPPNYDEQIADTVGRQTQMKDRHAALVASIVSLREHVKALPDNQKVLADSNAMQRQMEQMRRLNQVLLNATDHQRIITGLEVDLSRCTPETVNLDGLNAQIEALQQTIVAADQYRRALAEFERYGNAIVQLGAAPEPAKLPFDENYIVELERTAAELKSKHDVTWSNIDLYDNLSRTLQGKLVEGVECPVCGQPIKDATRLAHRKAELQAELRKYAPTPDMLKTASMRQTNKTVLEKSNQLIVSHAAQYNTLLAQYTRAEQIVDGMQAINDDPYVLRQQQEALIAKRNAATQEQKRYATLQADLASSRKQLAHCTAESLELQQALGTTVTAELDTPTDWKRQAELTQVRITELQNQLNNANELRQRLAEFEGMVKELENGIAALDSAIVILQDRRAKQGDYLNVIKTLTSVRDWFHYSNGPHTLAQGVLEIMVHDVNMFLEYFAAPFTVTCDESTLGFQCIFHDGRAMPMVGYPDASQLSGGQKIQLAVAFRFASYCMFANKLGLLSLDEPTVYLDDHNVGRFCALLNKIREVATRMNLQIFIATHEQSVKSFMDTIIDLTSTDESKVQDGKQQ
jgi:DNA repair exonuclease SbcCD ATPase subunit